MESSADHTSKTCATTVVTVTEVTKLECDKVTRGWAPLVLATSYKAKAFDLCSNTYGAKDKSKADFSKADEAPGHNGCQLLRGTVGQRNATWPHHLSTSPEHQEHFSRLLT